MELHKGAVMFNIIQFYHFTKVAESSCIFNKTITSQGS